MRTLMWQMMISLDGRFEGEDGALDWPVVEAGVIDEVRLVLCPVILGKGRSLLEGLTERHRLRLDSTRKLGSGVLILSYAPVRHVGR